MKCSLSGVRESERLISSDFITRLMILERLDIWTSFGIAGKDEAYGLRSASVPHSLLLFNAMQHVAGVFGGADGFRANLLH